jgi:hypothetical protein
MKKYLLMTLILGAFAVGTGNFTTALHSAPPAKEKCTDCGCKGPDGKGACPKEKGKDCSCEKN